MRAAVKYKIGLVVGKLTVTGHQKYKHFWLVKCRCECGENITVRPIRLASVTSCGCSDSLVTKKFKSRHPIGKRYGSLTVIGHETSKRAKPDCNGRVYDRRIVCSCACGATTSVRQDSLISGATTSCGCVGIAARVSAAMKIWKLNHGEAAFRSVFNSILRSAKTRGIEFNLLPEEVRTITRQSCEYCGQPPAQVRRIRRCNGEYVYSGIDRIDSSRGYCFDNVVPCCKACNYAKRSMTLEVFKAWVKRVHDRICV